MCLADACHGALTQPATDARRLVADSRARSERRQRRRDDINVPFDERASRHTTRRAMSHLGMDESWPSGRSWDCLRCADHGHDARCRELEGGREPMGTSPRHRLPSLAEVRARAVELARTSGTRSGRVVPDLDVSPDTIHRWPRRGSAKVITRSGLSAGWWHTGDPRRRRRPMRQRRRSRIPCSTSATSPHQVVRREIRSLAVWRP